MNDLPGLNSYSIRQTQEIAGAWPAVCRYLPLLERPASSPSDELRIRRHQAWLKCTFATFFQTASTETICQYWSEAAADLLKEAWRSAGAENHPVALFALGKLGACELNLSSDVDLIIVRADGAQVSFRQLRLFQGLITDVTEFGFCLRMDFDLRPGGRPAPLIPSESEFENHYGYYGETWERLALVRLRPLCGDKALTARVMALAHRFSFRKHLDYGLLEDLKLLRPRIHSSYQPTQSEEFNLKLGIGGIRDVELFIHALQVIHGGKFPSLRSTSTTKALTSLVAQGLYPEDAGRFLIESYWSYRSVENRLQACEDHQTYLITLKDEDKLKLPGCYAEIQKRRLLVDRHVSKLLGRVEHNPKTLPSAPEDQSAWLSDLGFSEKAATTIWPDLIAATAVSRTMERDERARRAFLQAFLESLSQRGVDRDLGLALLRDFTKAVRAKATFFSLFLHEPKLIDEMAVLFSTSPYLGQLLASRPELLDSFIFRKQDTFSGDDLDAFLEHLADRRTLSELISASQFLVGRDLDELLAAHSYTADQIALSLLNRLKKDFPESQIQLLALGKWGGEELGLRSDLDFIFTTPGTPTEADHKVARRFISRISESHKAGAIYAIDLRLRPSGRAGPIISSEALLSEYLQTRADVWERQAYLRARPLYAATVNPAQIAVSRGLGTEEVGQLRRIRSELLKTQEGSVDLKHNPGGFIDIEFAAQIALLKHGIVPEHPSTRAMIEALGRHLEPWRQDGPRLYSSYRELRFIEQLHQLTTHRSGSTIGDHEESLKRLAAVYEAAPHDLLDHIRLKLGENAETLKPLDPLRGSG